MGLRLLPPPDRAPKAQPPQADRAAKIVAAKPRRITMPKPKANAKFLIELAKKGRSFRPHTPKRYSDAVGLFWAVYREIIEARSHLVTFKRYEQRKREDGRISLVTPFPGVSANRLRSLEPLAPPLAMLRLYVYFLPIADDLGIIPQWSDICTGGRSDKQKPPKR